MGFIKSIKAKIILGSTMAALLLASGISLVGGEVSIVQERCLANAVPSSTVQQAAGAQAQPVIADNKEGLIRLYSISEINQYLAQMDDADLAAALKFFRVLELTKSKHIGEATNNELFTGAIKGTLNALNDPYSIYMDGKLYQEWMLDTKGSFAGVGIILGSKDKLLTVVAPIEGTPGDKAGIISGDQIFKINGQDTKDMVLDEAVNMIRGSEGSQVTLTINRPGQELQDYTITRTTIPIKTVGGKLLDNGIGYIRITMFNEHTGNDFAEKFKELEKQGLRAIILDLRNNPGGLVDESVKVAGYLVPKGPVVSVVAKDGSREMYYSRLEAPKYPLAVLVNGGSASASEIVAGAVQDTGAGTLIGTKTFGKGSVQTVVRLDNVSAIKLTFAKYFTPKDRSINGIGIEPDIKIEMPDFKENGRDLQMEKAVEMLHEALANR
ncbi:MAG TPA: S41 family peptidase [Negativicutes bacterium]|jgi:carboxyl-terminal processing protease